MVARFPDLLFPSFNGFDHMEKHQIEAGIMRMH